MIAHVPAIIYWRRSGASGGPYIREAWLPVSNLGLDREFVMGERTAGQRADAGKINVLCALPTLESGAILETSGEAWF